ncbi:MAG: acyloxyacyl hydrolase [Thermoanaerobaculia bacterium]|jgi:Lipid A 3-O-deacylase (PagL)
MIRSCHTRPASILATPADRGHVAGTLDCYHSPRMGDGCAVRVRVVALLLGGVVWARSARAEVGETLRIVSTVGAGFDFRPNEKASMTALGLARDYVNAQGSRFALSGELYPLIVFRQSTEDRTALETRPAIAAAGLATYRGGARVVGVGFRLEAGVGLSWAWYGSVPADGTRFNFYSQAGASAVWKRGNAPSFTLGYRYVHVSNLSLFPDKSNPGVSFHALVFAVEWPK